MPNDKLRDTVVELEQELLVSESVDPAMRARIQATLAEIRTLLHDGEPSTATTASLSERLSKAVEEFEESHPTLVTMIGRLADGLSQIGI